MTKQAHKRNSREAVWRAVAGVLGVLLLIWALLPLLRHILNVGVAALGAAGLLAAAKPAVSPDSQEALNLLMSREGFPIPREMPEAPESREGEDTISSGM